MHTHQLRSEIGESSTLRARLQKSQDIEESLLVAKSLHRLREAVIKGDWESAASNKLVVTFEEQHTSQPQSRAGEGFTAFTLDFNMSTALDCCRVEVGIVRTYCMTRRVRGALRRALMNNPSGCGTVAEEDALKELDAAISAALSLAPDSAQDLAVDAQRLLESASILRKVRILRQISITNRS